MDDAAARYDRAKELIATGDPSRLGEAEGLLRSGADAGHASSQFRLGMLLVVSEDGQRQTEGRNVLRAAAEAGHAKACFQLGLLHAHGNAGAELDTVEAVRWCTAAARLGLGVAQFNLGLLEVSGSGMPANPLAAARWLLRASCNGIAEADGCLDILYHRPRTWAEADTRASVVLARSDVDDRKPMRFSEYYADPAIDLVSQRFNLQRDEIEDAVQQFFLELEEPLVRGELRGQAWKEAIRHHYDPGKGDFRPYLGRALVNFVRNWIRDRDKPGRSDDAVDPDGEELVARHADEWHSLLAAFAAETAPRRPDAARAVQALRLEVGDGLPRVEVARQLAVSERMVRYAVRLGADLLREWCQHRLALLPGGDPVNLRLGEGVDLLPVWLHHPSADKRVRSLLLLSVIWRRIAGSAGTINPR